MDAWSSPTAAVSKASNKRKKNKKITPGSYIAGLFFSTRAKARDQPPALHRQPMHAPTLTCCVLHGCLLVVLAMGLGGHSSQETAFFHPGFGQRRRLRTPAVVYVGRCSSLHVRLLVPALPPCGPFRCRTPPTPVSPRHCAPACHGNWHECSHWLILPHI